MTAVEKLEELKTLHDVKVDYTVGFNQDLPPDVLDIIKHYKGDLKPEDIIPEHPTSLTIRVIKQGQLHKFYQDSTTYMEAFDKDKLDNFINPFLES